MRKSQSKETECRSEDKIHKEEWWINQSKLSIKNINSQKSGTSYNEKSDCEDSEFLSAAKDGVVSHSGAHALGWSGDHFRSKGNVSRVNGHESKVKSEGVHGIEKQPKIRVNNQMEDSIALYSAS